MTAIPDSGSFTLTIGSQTITGTYDTATQPPLEPAVAQFTTSQPSGSTLLLDATGSTGTLAWEVDGAPTDQHDPILRIGPLVVGTHHVKLTATGSTTATAERDIDVAWVATPILAAQVDQVNAKPGAIDLPAWSTLDPAAPWRGINVLNMAEGYPTAGDGTPRAVSYDDGSVSLLTKYGDRPTTATSGYRSALQWNNAYDATLSSLPFASTKSIDVCGMGDKDGHGLLRFYHVEIMFPSTNPNPWFYQNNAFEMHGTVGASSPIRFAPNGAGTQWGWVFQSIQLGKPGPQQIFDRKPTLYDTWYDYTVEMLYDTDPTVGYIRVYRDASPITTGVPAGTDAEGRYYAATQQTDKDGKIVLMALNAQNYRNAAEMPSDYPDATIHYRNIRVGPTLASVA